jgi:hypothetical protein
VRYTGTIKTKITELRCYAPTCDFYLPQFESTDFEKGFLMTEWFYVRDGQQNGPVTFEQLVALARSGGLTGRDNVWNASMQGWTPAGQVPGIFDLYIGPEIPPVVNSSNPYTGPEIPASNASNPYSAPQSDWSKPFATAGVALTEIAPGSEVIDPMACINRGIEITKRQFGSIFLLGLVYLVCVIGLSFGMLFIEGIIGAVSSGGNSNPGDPSAASIIISLIGQLVQNVVAIFLQLGLTRAGLNLVSGKDISVEMLFGEGSKLLRALGASILLGLAVVIGLILLIVPGIYIAMRYGQVIPAIVDRDLGIFEAFSYSESITTNNRMNLFLLGLLNLLALIVGAIPCGLGLIFIGPVVWLAALVAYRWMQYGPGAAQDHNGTEIPMLKGM